MTDTIGLLAVPAVPAPAAAVLRGADDGLLPSERGMALNYGLGAQPDAALRTTLPPDILDAVTTGRPIRAEPSRAAGC